MKSLSLFVVLTLSTLSIVYNQPASNEFLKIKILFKSFSGFIKFKMKPPFDEESIC
ncbi:hypothetical protein BH20ACI4_BH20ACI4_23880 [soil metagenome]